MIQVVENNWTHNIRGKDELFVSVPYHRMAGIIESIPLCTAGTAKTEYPPEFKQLVGDSYETES